MIGALATLLVTFAQQSLVVVPAPGIELTNPAWARAELGVVDILGDKAVIERRFRLKNDGSEDIVLTAPQLSCGCASAVIAGRQFEGFKLEPGAEAEVSVAIDVTKLKMGFFDKYLWIYAKGRVQPIVTLQFAGRMKPVVTFDPPAIRFGRTSAKEARPVQLKLSIDRRLADMYPDAVLSSSTPDVLIRPGGSAVAGDMIERKYTVALSPKARIGMLNATVSLTPRRSAVPVTERSLEQLKRYAMAISGAAPVVGEVTGSFSASPGTVVFGAIAAGRESQRQIEIVSTHPIDASRLKIESACKWLSAKCTDLKPSTRLTLNVVFSSATPAGACDTQLLITNPAGEQLVVPVLAYVTR